MATFTFTSVGDFFGIGTSVSAYVPAGNPESASPVSGSAIATASVASDGSLTFTGLADDTRYVAYDVSSGKRKAFRTLPLVVDSSTGSVTRDSAGRVATFGNFTVLTRDSTGRVATYSDNGVTRTITRDSTGKVASIA